MERVIQSLVFAHAWPDIWETIVNRNASMEPMVFTVLRSVIVTGFIPTDVTMSLENATVIKHGMEYDATVNAIEVSGDPSAPTPANVKITLLVTLQLVCVSVKEGGWGKIVIKFVQPVSLAITVQSLVLHALTVLVHATTSPVTVIATLVLQDSVAVKFVQLAITGLDVSIIANAKTTESVILPQALVTACQDGKEKIAAYPVLQERLASFANKIAVASMEVSAVKVTECVNVQPVGWERAAQRCV